MSTTSPSIRLGNVGLVEEDSLEHRGQIGGTDMFREGRLEVEVLALLVASLEGAVA
jgi:hypothetical protein